MRKLIKRYINSYREIVSIVVFVLWNTGNIIEQVTTGYCVLNNLIWFFIMSIMIIVDRTNNRFRKWLNTPLYKTNAK